MRVLTFVVRMVGVERESMFPASTLRSLRHAATGSSSTTANHKMARRRCII